MSQAKKVITQLNNIQNNVSKVIDVVKDEVHLLLSLCAILLALPHLVLSSRFSDLVSYSPSPSR